MIHYRYTRDYDFLDFVSGRKISLIEFITKRETKHGYWICRKGWSNYKDAERFVLKNSKKRYAYPTKEEAFNNFKLRTESSLRFAKSNVESAEVFIKLINEFKIK